MAPTEGASPKTGAAGEVQKWVADGDDDYHSDTLPRMTPELLQSICKERQMWTQPHLNTQLYLNYKGFRRIEAMEDYINVKSLHLDNNNICRIEGLDRMTELRSLHLGGNRLSQIENLQSNIDLRHLNLEGNAIGQVTNVGHLVKLEILNLKANRIEHLEDLTEIQELPALSNVDVSDNSIEAQEGVVEFWSEFKTLKVLRYHGNPGVRHISHYRKLIVNALPNLSYMDERPIFEIERKSSEAWAEGGLTAMHEAKKKFTQGRLAASRIDPERREFLTQRRNREIERLDREAAERAVQEEQQRLDMEKKMSALPVGAGRKAQEGNADALQEYEKGWMTKVKLYGVDGVRDKVTKETGGRGGNFDFGRKPGGDFDFGPPIREAAVEPEMRAEVLDQGPESVHLSAPSSAGNRWQDVKKVEGADFRHRSSGEENNANTFADRQFAVLDGADVDYSLGDSAETSGGPHCGQASAGRPAAGRGSGAADNSTMPLIWERRMAENSAAEAECLDQNMAIMRACREEAGGSGPAAFRTGQLEALD